MGHNHLWIAIFIVFYLFFFFLCSSQFPALTHKLNGLTLLLRRFSIAIYRTNVHNASSEMTENFTKPFDRVNKNEAVYVAPGTRNDNISKADSCLGRYIYVHDLPSQFNDDMLKNCSYLLIPWYDMCPYLTNSGLGRRVHNPEGVLTESSWFATNQFVLEIIFRNRMKNYKCLINDSSLASAVFVPSYTGLDAGRYLWAYNASMRDALGLDMAKWLAQRPEWRRMWGRDHFFVAGRIASDFRRRSNNDSDWGTKLMFLPESMNMTMLSIESTSWSNEFAIPYPTHFHPSSKNEILQWQNRMRKHKRQYLFSFSGAPRPFRNDSIRTEIINHCLASWRTCKLLDCKSQGNKCENPVEVIKVFQDSIFCLQPPGDSYTRRSTFESILAGCIPVFFHPGSAYAQYLWYLPKNYTKYSVFMPENLVKEGKVSINETLLQVSKDQVLAMREELIKLIPKVIYADFRSKSEALEDAFDIAVMRVLERVQNVRREIKEGKDPRNGFAEENTWKLKLSGIGEEHEWDHFFWMT